MSISSYLPHQTQLDDHAMIAERLIMAARERGIKINTLLIDRGLYSVDVMNKLDEHGVRYLMPAIKNERIKRAIEEHHNGLIPNMVKFSIRNAAEQQAFFGLMIYPKKGAKKKETDPTHERYIVFATNMRTGRRSDSSPRYPTSIGGDGESRRATECRIRSRPRQRAPTSPSGWSTRCYQSSSTTRGS
jgi:hypothetical protein